MLSQLHAVNLNHPTLLEHTPLARLAAAVLISAYKDLESEKPAIYSKAYRFFRDQHFRVWADAAGIDHDLIIAGYENVSENGFPVDGRKARFLTDEGE